MYEDVKVSPVSDVLISTDEGLSLVATVAREFFTEQVSAQLRSSVVNVIGKVALVSGSEPINLMRRTVLAMADEADTADMFSGFPGMQNSSERIHIQPPFVQVMPLAIYI
jgi:hypothetical protein